MWWMRADGGGEPQRLVENKNPQIVGSFAPDSKFLLFTENDPQNGSDI